MVLKTAQNARLLRRDAITVGMPLATVNKRSQRLPRLQGLLIGPLFGTDIDEHCYV